VKTKAELDAANQWHTYQKGWVDGSHVRAMNPVCTGNDNLLIRAAYNYGYTDGRTARNEAMQKAALRYGYEPSILRLMDNFDRRVSGLVGDRPVRVDGTRVEVFNIDPKEQLGVLRKLHSIRQEIEDFYGDSVSVIFHTRAESKRLYAEFIEQFNKGT